MKSARAAVALAMPLFLSLSIFAQDKKEANRGTYKVLLNLRDTSQPGAGAGRQYSMVLDNQGHGLFRIGNRIPVPTESKHSGDAALASTQYTYIDVGVNIECSVRETDGTKLGMRASIEISSVVPPDKLVVAAADHPIIGQLRMGIDTLLDPGQPMVVASIDDPVTARKLEVEATVTKMN
jgi:hypothetical protein